jgi:FkbM family methyltransferase
MTITKKCVKLGCYLLANLIPKRAIPLVISSLQCKIGFGNGAYVNTSGEIPFLRSLANLAGESFCVFDVGANRGHYAQGILNIFDQITELQVHCFEPAGATFSLLASSFDSLHNCNINNFALGSSNRTSNLYVDEQYLGLSSQVQRTLLNSDQKFHFNKEAIEIKTLDCYAERNKISHIDLLKIDVEGSELDVLNGAKTMFSKNSIGIVQFEFGACNIESKIYFRDFYLFFSSYQYALARITPSGRLYPVSQYDPSLEIFSTSNYVAIPISSKYGGLL